MFDVITTSLSHNNRNHNMYTTVIFILLSLFDGIKIKRVDCRRMNRLNVLIFAELQCEKTTCCLTPH